jgi:hypothetical protein
MTAETGPEIVGRCHRCDQWILVGQEDRRTVHGGTGASPDVLLHRDPCRPRTAVRTWT